MLFTLIYISIWASILRPFRFLHPSNHSREYGKMHHMRGIMREGRSHSEADSESITFHEEYARVTNVIECKEMTLTYYQDYAGKFFLFYCVLV